LSESDEYAVFDDRPVLERMLVVTTWTMPKDRWCAPCAKSSLVESPVILVTVTGAGPWGTATKCLECNVWVWRSLKGNVIPVKLVD
jgi:hypothetical protein